MIKEESVRMTGVSGRLHNRPGRYRKIIQPRRAGKTVRECGMPSGRGGAGKSEPAGAVRGGADAEYAD